MRLRQDVHFSRTTLLSHWPRTRLVEVEHPDVNEESDIDTRPSASVESSVPPRNSTKSARARCLLQSWVGAISALRRISTARVVQVSING
jgi:hypothetical protein